MNILLENNERNGFMTYQETWDMNSVFPGGSDSPAFYEKVASIKDQLSAFDTLVQDWGPAEDAPTFQQLEEILKTREEITKGIGETRTFISGLSSANNVRITESRCSLSCSRTLGESITKGKEIISGHFFFCVCTKDNICATLHLGP